MGPSCWARTTARSSCSPRCDVVPIRRKSWPASPPFSTPTRKTSSGRCRRPRPCGSGARGSTRSSGCVARRRPRGKQRTTTARSSWRATRPSCRTGWRTTPTRCPRAPYPRSTRPAPPTAGESVDDLLRVSLADEYEIRVSELPAEPVPIAAPLPPPVAPPPRPPPPPPPPETQPESTPPPSSSPFSLSPSATPPPMPAEQPAAEEEEVPERTTHVPSAAEKHAGMLDPWAENEAPTRDRQVDGPRVGSRPCRCPWLPPACSRAKRW